MVRVINLSKKRTYGSIINRIQETACMFPIDFKVTVGFGGTDYMWTDSHAYSVCSVNPNWQNKNFEIIGVQRDNAERTDNNGMSESQSYKFTPNKESRICYLKSEIVETVNGKRKLYQPVSWNENSKRWNKGGTAVTLGHRNEYHDYSF